jgi:hypothetical protein
MAISCPFEVFFFLLNLVKFVATVCFKILLTSSFISLSRTTFVLLILHFDIRILYVVVDLLFYEYRNRKI